MRYPDLDCNIQFETESRALLETARSAATLVLRRVKRQFLFLCAVRVGGRARQPLRCLVRAAVPPYLHTSSIIKYLLQQCFVPLTMWPRKTVVP